VTWPLTNNKHSLLETRERSATAEIGKECLACGTGWQLTLHVTPTCSSSLGGEYWALLAHADVDLTGAKSCDALLNRFPGAFPKLWSFPALQPRPELFGTLCNYAFGQLATIDGLAQSSDTLFTTPFIPVSESALRTFATLQSRQQPFGTFSIHTFGQLTAVDGLSQASDTLFPISFVPSHELTLWTLATAKRRQSFCDRFGVDAGERATVSDRHTTAQHSLVTTLAEPGECGPNGKACVVSQHTTTLESFTQLGPTSVLQRFQHFGGLTRIDVVGQAVAIHCFAQSSDSILRSNFAAAAFAAFDPIDDGQYVTRGRNAIAVDIQKLAGSRRLAFAGIAVQIVDDS
jgi:hypothetical protein